MSTRWGPANEVQEVTTDNPAMYHEDHINGGQKQASPFAILAQVKLPIPPFEHQHPHSLQ